jgi:hypothetical protein
MCVHLKCQNSIIEGIAFTTSKKSKKMARKKELSFLPCTEECNGCVICLLSLKSVTVSDTWEKTNVDRFSVFGQFLLSRLDFKKKIKL